MMKQTDPEAGQQLSHREMAYLYWLHGIDGIGSKTIAVLAAFLGTAEDIYRQPEGRLQQFLNRRQLESLKNSKKIYNVEKEYENLLRKGIRFLPYGHKEYPGKLLSIPDPPAALYVKGQLPGTDRCTVAMIGTRRCSSYGSAMAKQFGARLAHAHVQVVSGLAKGIDGIGQRAVVEAGGSTFAVLGCGVDICYPCENTGLYHKIIHEGGIISEYPPGTQPKAQLFPPRNRIISGLSDVVLVIEAKEKSGTLITVDMALEQGKEVYALPGRLADDLSRGCNRLIKQGAGMVLSVEDFLLDVGVKETGNETGITVIQDITIDECRVLQCLEYTPKSLEQIMQGCADIEVYRLPQVMIGLCMKGMAEQVGMGYYMKKAGV